MQQHPPPVAIVAPGKCFRRDALDARHLFQFHQIEGLLVARGMVGTDGAVVVAGSLYVVGTARADVLASSVPWEEAGR